MLNPLKNLSKLKKTITSIKKKINQKRLKYIFRFMLTAIFDRDIGRAVPIIFKRRKEYVSITGIFTPS